MPAKAAKAPVRAKRTKTEIQREFDEIQEQSADARESADPKIEEASRRHETEVREAVEGVTVESAVQRISGLGVEISKALSGLSGKLTEEVQLLASVREAVGLERKELDRLHKIDVAATALDQLVQDYARQKQELETEIATRRAAWEEEAARVDRERKEQEEALKKQRQREGEDFDYKKTQERKKAQDKYEEEIRLQEKKNQEKQETIEKSWQLREAVLKEREEELARLRKESEAFPKRLEAEASAAAERARRESEARLQQEIAGHEEGCRSRETVRRTAGEDIRRNRGPSTGADRGPRKATRRCQAAGAGHRRESHRRRKWRQGALTHQSDCDGAGQEPAAGVTGDSPFANRRNSPGRVTDMALCVTGTAAGSLSLVRLSDRSSPPAFRDSEPLAP